MSFLNPTSIAVVGASSEPAKVGGAIFQNLITQGYQGNVYPVNAKHSEVLGKKAYKSVSDLPEVPELVVIVTPAATVEAVAKECATELCSQLFSQ
jgi:acetyltransferase